MEMGDALPGPPPPSSSRRTPPRVMRSSRPRFCGTTRHAAQNNRRRRRGVLVVAFAVALTAVVLMMCLQSSYHSSHHDSWTAPAAISQSSFVTSRRLAEHQRKIIVLAVAAPADSPIARKQQQDLQQQPRLSGAMIDPVLLQPRISTLPEQRAFVQTHSCGVDRFDQLVAHGQHHLATELWKYCAFVKLGTTEQADGIVYTDIVSPLMVRLPDLLGTYKNVAVLGDDYFVRTIHGALLMMSMDTSRSIGQAMLQVLVETSVDALQTNSLLLPKTLYELIVANTEHDPLTVGRNGNDWHFLQQQCHVDPLRRPTNGATTWTDAQSYRVTHHCPKYAGFCCSIHDAEKRNFPTVLMTQHPLLPYQRLPPELPKPYNAEAGHFEDEELPFISTIRERVPPKPVSSLMPATPNFFDMLLANDCLPASDSCSKCLKDKRGADCNTCGNVCLCFCKMLCHEVVPKKFVAKEWTIAPPLYARDPNRLVPRIIHQTWFEPLERERYPNMSRLVESFKRSGWEYKFYSDDDAANFLSTHFPAEVREAYDTLRPGAFKADLFRYCALLVHGGVYADVDIMLESALDFSVGPDIGFMVPVDEPGIPAHHRMCVWNGLIASAPGHPFLAKAIETVVNQVRNRFTSVDVDATFCPNPELSVLHAFDTLFTAGPCLLGSSINRVLGRDGQESFVPGELIAKEGGSASAASFVIGTNEGGNGSVNSLLPGRTIILHQDKWDMGSHRFTFVERNLVVAATDLQDSNDRDKITDSAKTEHYSKTHAKTGIYGLENLYVDKQKANEDIRLFVDMSRGQQPLHPKTVAAAVAA